MELGSLSCREVPPEGHAWLGSRLFSAWPPPKGGRGAVKWPLWGESKAALSPRTLPRTPAVAG